MGKHLCLSVDLFLFFFFFLKNGTIWIYTFSKMPTGSVLFDPTNSQSSSESEEEKEKPLCRPESDEDLSVEYWHIQKLVDDLRVQELSGFLFCCILEGPSRANIFRPLFVTLNSFTLLIMQQLHKIPHIYPLQKWLFLVSFRLKVMLWKGTILRWFYVGKMNVINEGRHQQTGCVCALCDITLGWF